MVKFIGSDLIANGPGPLTGRTPSETERFREPVENAVLCEQLGFDGFSVGERHHQPFLSSAPPVVLSRIAAKTSRIRLFAGVTLLSALDPVRVAEDYATLDHLSGGRIELVIGKGNGPEQTYPKHWADLGRDPADAVVGAGTAGFYTARTSQEAVETFRPIHEALPAGLVRAQFVDSLELFQSDIAPELRRSIPGPPWPPAITS